MFASADENAPPSFCNASGIWRREIARKVILINDDCCVVTTRNIASGRSGQVSGVDRWRMTAQCWIIDECYRDAAGVADRQLRIPATTTTQRANWLDWLCHDEWLAEWPSTRRPRVTSRQSSTVATVDARWRWPPADVRHCMTLRPSILSTYQWRNWGSRRPAVKALKYTPDSF